MKKVGKKQVKKKVSVKKPDLTYSDGLSAGFKLGVALTTQQFLDHLRPVIPPQEFGRICARTEQILFEKARRVCLGEL